MPTYNSNILVNLNLTGTSTLQNTETFSESAVDEIHDMLHTHLSNTFDRFEIDFESVTTELVVPATPSTEYTPMSSLNQGDSSYTPLVQQAQPAYTPLTSI